MRKVCLMEFDKIERHFKILGMVEFSSIPTKGDKVVFDIDGVGHIFNVYDVHYADKNSVDVNIIRISTIAEYNSSGFPDIT